MKNEQKVEALLNDAENTESVAVQRARQIADERRRLARESRIKCSGCRRMETDRLMDEFKAALIDGEE